jgi:hypothetical protein
MVFRATGLDFRLGIEMRIGGFGIWGYMWKSTERSGL